jgi:hypothetical protein
MTIETTESSTRGRESKYAKKRYAKKRLTDRRRNTAVEEAIQDLVRKGLVVDSGHRRWSQRTGRYEIVWESKVFGKTFQ